ncbi:zinc ABC transporter ATP-binding protein AztA [Ancylobacter radicis]|uniref:ABC transporter ATP-binding protein n=1 Tax=Ancylobacter radicis TaxID=2836179 RepID=A0ABS5RDW7_9HYPH|nr:zinc ABC transporter ATP-binding protein AztA [Ancylobacter radicis]MBS9479267.1 ABC transporter ATP-binding protein [Ancylobacter radicis]
MGAVLSFRDLTLGYERHPAVHHLAGDVTEGALLAVCGPNGAGKSTLLKGIAGVLSPLAGRIDCTIASRDIAYLPQAAEIDRSFPIDVYDLVSMGLWHRSGLFGGIARADRARIEQAIATVGLEGFENRPIGTLSGGQMQRTLFARLLLQEARLILLDEPFTALDAGTVADLVALVERWNGEGRTVLAVLHDLELVRSHFPQTLLLARQPVAWGETREVLTTPNLSAARRMCEAWDETAPFCAPEQAA